MKRFWLISAVCVVLLALGIWAGKWYFFSQGALVTVQIRPGQTGGEVARLLKEKGVVSFLKRLFEKITKHN